MRVGEPTFFANPGALRRWLTRHGAGAAELWIGFHKAAADKKGVSYQQALDEALCFGWIDAVRKGLGAEAWTIRFTPRRPRSIWSQVNLARVQVLIAERRMTPAGLAVFEARDPAKTKRYSFEQRSAGLTPAQEKAFRINPGAWKFWKSQPPGYRKVASWWVISAKKEETRARRLATLIALSAEGARIPQLARPVRG